jgi:hypothetical protein
MTDARLVEMWLRMTADAVRGTDDAKRALGALGEGPLSPPSLEAWMKLWLAPGGQSGSTVSSSEVTEFHTMLEDWWRLLGVVPRYRYDELDKHYAELKRRLEESERTVHRLRRALGQGGEQAEAKSMLDAWETLTEQTLASQSEWTRQLLQGWGVDPGDEDQEDDTEQ